MERFTITASDGTEHEVTEAVWWAVKEIKDNAHARAERLEGQIDRVWAWVGWCESISGTEDDVAKGRRLCIEEVKEALSDHAEGEQW